MIWPTVAHHLYMKHVSILHHFQVYHPCRKDAVTFNASTAGNIGRYEPSKHNYTLWGAVWHTHTISPRSCEHVRAGTSTL